MGISSFGVRRVRVATALSLVIVASVTEIRTQEPPQTPAAMPGAMSPEESAAVSEGWTLLAQGKALQAAAQAVAILAKFPTSMPALVLAVEADVGSAGSAAALGRYEAWLGTRLLEEPSVLRTIARAMLKEIGDQPQNPRGQLAALKGLAEDGDAASIERLRKGSDAGGLGETKTLASFGDSGAVQILIADLSTGASDKLGVMEALGTSGDRAAIEPLARQLQDPEPVLRGTAAEALGQLGDKDAASLLKPFLNDSSGFVRTRAAAALVRLGDDSGWALLSELASSEEASGRIVAAEALASRPDEKWLAMVRELTRATEPEIRLSAARLLASHDPDAARLVLDQLASDDNPAIREEAVRISATDVPANLPALRALLKNGDRLVRVAAASKLLTLTR